MGTCVLLCPLFDCGTSGSSPVNSHVVSDYYRGAYFVEIAQVHFLTTYVHIYAIVRI